MLKTVLPLLVMLAALAGGWAIMDAKPPPAPPAPAAEFPVVSVLRVVPQRLRLSVHSQGLAAPRTEIDVLSEVAGKVIWLHPDFVAGGFFARDAVLVAVDARDYALAVKQAQARIAEARRMLAFEQAQAEQAKSEWQALGEGRPTPLILHEPQLAEARAKLQAAEADLAQAQLQISRCELRAPFAGRLREKSIGLGQILRPGDKLARVYATDSAEVRLPLAPDQLAFLDLPSGPNHNRPGPKVRLSAEFAGVLRHWDGRIVRTEGAVDAATGLLHAVAEVRAPYAGPTPLLAGLFVQADIEGREQAGLFVLPPGAVNSADEVLLVDADNRLRIRQLEILRHEPTRVLVKSGLQAGDRVVTSNLPTPVEGMSVRVENADAAARP